MPACASSKNWASAMCDLVVRGDARDIAIEDGKIVAIGPELPGAAEEIDARGLHAFPAGVRLYARIVALPGPADGGGRQRPPWLDGQRIGIGGYSKLRPGSRQYSS